MNNNAAILVAAGGGSRCEDPTNKTPKQFYLLAGKPLYLWSLEVLFANALINKVVMVTVEDKISQVIQELKDRNLYKKITVIPGGPTRRESVWMGLNWLNNVSTKPNLVLIHDAARPFITNALIEVALSTAKEHGACTLAVPISDTIKQVLDSKVVKTVVRDSLFAIHTPQVARFEWLWSAHQQAISSNIEVTDDGAILERCGYPVTIAPSSTSNFKVTFPEDLVMAEALATKFKLDRR